MIHVQHEIAYSHGMNISSKKSRAPKFKREKFENSAGIARALKI